MNTKKYAFQFLFFLTVIVMSIYSVDQDAQAEMIKEVRFDYHGVIVDRDKRNATLCFAQLYARNILDVNLYVAGPQVLWKSMHDEDVSIDNLVRDFSRLDKYYENLYECLEVLDKPNLETIKLIKKLRSNNVKIVLASNMHEDSLAHHKKSRQEIFDLFDMYFISGKMHGKKPHKKFYEDLGKEVNEQFCKNNEECIKNKQTIFVDDKKENVDGAQKVDSKIKGFVFKDAQTFEAYLKKENFLPSENNEEV